MRPRTPEQPWAPFRRLHRVGWSRLARAQTSLAIGDGAILGAGSVLTGSIPAGEIRAGHPARLLKKRNA